MTIPNQRNQTVSVVEAAARLGIDGAELYRLIFNRRFRAVPDEDGRFRVRVADLEEYGRRVQEEQAAAAR